MLEKIGLPAKPSMRGANWVIDASHCQGCSSQFTFINRKHHCRRCGGLFCNNCTLQRIVLRGQGDSSVRICDPCKRLEEAARFELRYGHKNRTAKGSTKYSSKHEDDVIAKILGTDGVLSGQEPELDVNSFRSLESISSSSSTKVDESYHRKEDFASTMSSEIQGSVSTDFESASPEELRQRASDEKKKYKILKAEGRTAEALQAFKRGKELERQAGVLEIALRKSRRLASKAPNSTVSTVAQNLDGLEDSKSKQKMPSHKTNEAKSDLDAELKELGWSDADLHDSDAKPKKISLEGELSNLLGEVTRSSSTGRKKSVDKSEVTAIKKRALLLKREGKLAEAKEELKKAKILEKKLEEEELLGESEESEDEISALIRSMDEDKQDDFLLDHASGLSIGFDQFNGLTDDLPIDTNLDVTDFDMNDPELAAALKSFGWSEEDDEHAAHREENQEPVGNQIWQSVPLDRESLQEKILNLKKEALNQKRAGNVSEAKELLKRAKLLERDLESGVSPAPLIASEGNIPPSFSKLKTPNRSKINIQQELLALKKRALSLRREGRMDEAEEELKKGKSLEQQLEQMENATKRIAPKVAEKNVVPTHAHDGAFDMVDLREAGGEAEVTEEDMLDPALMSALKNLGWDDDDVEPIGASHKNSELVTTQPLYGHKPSPFSGKALTSKGEIQKELLAIKRRALALRRQGKITEAEDELEKAKALENQMAEMENATKSDVPKFDKRNQDLTNLDGVDHGLMVLGEQGPETEVTYQDMHDPSLLSALNNLGWSNDDVEPLRVTNESSTQMNDQSIHQSEPLSLRKVIRSKAEIQRELLAIKRKALALRRQGKSDKAEEELEKAKALEAELEISSETLATKVGKNKHLQDNDSGIVDLGEVNSEAAGTKKHFSDSTLLPTDVRFNDDDGEARLSEPSFSESRRLTFESQMVTGTLLPAKETFLEGSSILNQPGQSRNLLDVDDEESTSMSTSRVSVRRENIDSSILSITSAFTQPMENSNSKSKKPSNEKETDVAATIASIALEQNLSRGTDPLKNEILAHKRKALALKREGKLVEAREELRLAKLLERSLEHDELADAVGISMSVQKSIENDGQADAVGESVSASLGASLVQDKTSQKKKPLSGRDRFRIQQESLTHKRNALKLRREGKLDEAETELELAKSLEKQLEDSDQNPSSDMLGGKLEAKDELMEDLLDPQLMSALKAIGIVDAPILVQHSEKVDSPPIINKNDNRVSLEEQIKADKLRALNLKKAGKQAEALEALRSAKRLEKKLASLG